jgi:excisionase family DNA binding protein
MSHEPPLLEPLLVVEDVRHLLGVTKTWVYDHLTRVEPILPHYRLGNTIRFRREDVAAFVQQCRVTKPTWDRDRLTGEVTPRTSGTPKTCL